jgi:hypothetical protein
LPSCGAPYNQLAAAAGRHSGEAVDDLVLAFSQTVTTAIL